MRLIRISAKYLFILMSVCTAKMVAADSGSNRATIDSDQIAWDLDPHNPSFEEDTKSLALQPFVTFQDLIIGEHFRDDDVFAAAAFSRLLSESYGHGSVLLLSSVNDHLVPAFSGVLSDRSGKILCNLKIGVPLPKGDGLPFYASKCLKKIVKYSDPESWVEYVLKMTRVIAEVERNAPIDQLILNGDQYAQYREAILATRKMMQIFAPGGGRPNRVLIKVITGRDVTFETFDETAKISLLYPTSSEILVIQGSKLTSIKEGEVGQRTLELCERGLVPKKGIDF